MSTETDRAKHIEELSSIIVNFLMISLKTKFAEQRRSLVPSEELLWA